MGETEIPTAWLALPAHQRDVLFTLDDCGPLPMHNIWERIGGVEDRKAPNSTRRNVGTLREKGLVEQREKSGREKIHGLTAKGQMLVDAAREVWA